jgi:poly-gamma-glutamate synthesis protein (capsule biosynthesis protein)
VYQPKNIIRPNTDKIPTTSSTFTPWSWKKIKFVAVGDFIPHGAVMQSARDHATQFDSFNFDGYRYLVDQVSALIDGDVNMINFESPCAPSKPLHGKSYIFNAPEEALDALHWAGFNLFLLANNHMYDQGRDGFRETIQVFREKGYLFSGANLSKKDALKPVILQIKDVKVGILSFTQFLNSDFNHPDSSWINILNKKEALKIISRYRDSLDIFILTYHGGQEYENYPTKRIQEFFHAAIDSGIQVIIGGHPHVPQPLEVYQAENGRVGLIFYSLGNFVSNQSRKYRHPISDVRYGDTRDVPIATFTMALVDYGPNGKKWEIQDVGIIPCWTENNFYQALNGAKRDIHIVSIFHEMKKIDQMLENLMEDLKIHQKKLQQLANSDADSTGNIGEKILSSITSEKNIVQKYKSQIDSLISRKAHFIKRLKRFEQIFGDEFIINPLQQ